MKFRQLASRRAAWTLWVCALALLLKAAMPMLASASAHAQGRALIEVCTVYGVARVFTATPDAADFSGLSSGVTAGASTALAPGSDTSDSGDSGDHSAAHRTPHCALTALLAWSTPAPPALAWRITPRFAYRATPHHAPLQASPADACAAWVAQLRHGPPTRT